MGSSYSAGLLFLITLLTPPISYGDELHAKPVIESIEGGKTLTLFIGKEKREIAAGTEVEIGEKIKTNATTSATLRYPDGSKVIIAAGSLYIIEEQIDGTQWNRLKEGSVRGIITKTSIPTPTKPKFIIRNKAAVLGVRGTDFIMGLGADGTSEVHTLEGSVEVARDEVAILNHSGTIVNEGTFVRASKDGMSAPQTFNKEEFLKSFNSGSSSSNISNPETPLSVKEEGTPSVSSTQELSPPPSPPEGMPAPQKFPVPEKPEPKIEIHQKKNPTAQSDEKDDIDILSFQTGYFFTQLLDNTQIQAITALWTPRFVFPVLSFLSVHGSFGGHLSPTSIQDQRHVIIEYELFVTASFLNLIFAEGGMGEQIWRGDRNYDAGLATVNAGLLTKLGFIDRIFIGYQVINSLPIFNQYKVGVGLRF